jgi:glycosyltransferase involved in cell wall biosynthesis
MTRRILFIAMQNSPHTARWINLIADNGWDLHLFAINDLPILPEMRGVTVHRPWARIRPRMMLKTFLKNPTGFHRNWHDIETQLNPDTLPVRSILPLPVIPPIDRMLNRARPIRLGESDAYAPRFYGPWVLSRLIRRLKPHLIHSMEFQHCGYNVLRTKEVYGPEFPPWLATNWGSDIYYYRNFPDHRSQITRLLKNIDYYSCECRRDVALAQELGLTGKVMPVLPNTGGFDLEHIDPLRQVHRPSARRLIMVKGYQHFAGRALTALDALERCTSELKDYRVVVFSASPEVYERVEELRCYLNMDIQILPYSNHKKMLRMFARARIYLGVSISDAISTSMLEAMAMGAFPIQTNTSCCEEWIADGRSGFVISSGDVDQIADRIRRAVMDDALVDTAAEINWKTVQERLDMRLLKERAIAFYDEIFMDMKRKQIGNQKYEYIQSRHTEERFPDVAMP